MPGKNWKGGSRGSKPRQRIGSHGTGVSGGSGAVGVGKRPRDDRDYEDKRLKQADLVSPKLMAYYSALGVFGWDLPGASPSLPPPPPSPAAREEDRKLYDAAMHRPLPASFRISSYASPAFRELFTSKTLALLEDMTLEDVETAPQVAGEPKAMKTIKPATRIPFLEGGFQLDVDKRMIKKSEKLTALQNWLKEQTEYGYITRQETVSMIPPAVMDVMPGHKVLDMCAAPGSKTTQLLEVVSQYGHVTSSSSSSSSSSSAAASHSSSSSSSSSSSFSTPPSLPLEPSGFVLANDADQKRAYLLVHQCKRINSPALIITNHDGQVFPISPKWRNDGNGNEGAFDRVLCDVPCTGDGTLRKNLDMWKKWSQSGPISIHTLQLLIAMRGLRLCKVGGLMVYSTCSMNPLENEAVVAEIVRRAGEGAVEIVDGRTLVKNGTLVGRKGMKTWQVWDDRKFTVSYFEGLAGGKPAAEAPSDDVASNWTDAHLEAQCNAAGLYRIPSFAEVPEKLKGSFAKTLFPPTPLEADSMHLERCIRIHPQDMDTGGFFVTVLRKLKPIGVHKKSATKAKGYRGEMVENADGSSAAAAEGGGEEEVDEDDVEEAAAAAGLTVEVDEDGNAIVRAPEESTMEDDKPSKKTRTQNVPSEVLANQQFIKMPADFFAGMKEAYGFTDDTPFDQFLSRSEQNKSLQFIPKSIMELMDSDVSGSLKIVHSGVKIIERNSHNSLAKVHYRVSQEGVHLVVPYMTKRLLYCGRRDFSIICGGGMIDLRHMSEEFQALAKETSQGCFVAILEEAKDRFMEKLMIVCWKNLSYTFNSLADKTSLDCIKARMLFSNFWVDPGVLPELPKYEGAGQGDSAMKVDGGAEEVDGSTAAKNEDGDDVVEEGGNAEGDGEGEGEGDEEEE